MRVSVIVCVTTVLGFVAVDAVKAQERPSPLAVTQPPPPATMRRVPPTAELRTPPAVELRPMVPPTENQPSGMRSDNPPEPVLPPSPTAPIDLNTALRLAGVQNPDLLLARQRVTEAEALRQLAAAQFLPTLNAGTNYDSHTGVLQQSNGNMLSVNRSAIYVGAGTNAIAAGSVNIPGIVLSGNFGAAAYAYLASRQVVAQREAGAIAVRNQTFLAVTLAYSELLRAEGKLAIGRQVELEARIIARLTADYAATGQGRQADANRAATELAARRADIQRYEGDVVAASAKLAQVLNLDPSVRLEPTDAWVVPHPIVPTPIPLNELIATALLNRPELAERRAAVAESLYALSGAKILPFSPNMLIGFSGGAFGGGSNLVHPVFGGFGGRSDLDILAYWTIQNMGIGNVALIRLANARLQMSRFQELGVLNRVRAEVAEAYALSHARFAQITTTEQAVASGARALREDYERIQARAERDVLPIELLDSFRLKARSMHEYLDNIVDYDRSQFQLYVALGQPPADVLARPVPSAGVPTLPMSAPGSPRPTAPGGPTTNSAPPVNLPRGSALVGAR